MTSFSPTTLTGLVLFCFVLCSFTVQERIEEKGRSGDIVVLEQASTVYILKLSKDPLSLFIVKAPKQLLERTKKTSWIEWLKEGTDGASDTLLTRLSDLPTHFPELSALLALDWKELLPTSRKKKGSQPLAGEIDFRPLWNPKVIVEGKSLSNCPSLACEAFWPKDGSETAGKRIVAYFPECEGVVLWFPYWVDLPGIKASLFVLDSQRGQ